MKQNNDELPIVFVSGTYDWIKDMFFAGIQLCGALILGALGLICLTYGLRAAGLI